MQNITFLALLRPIFALKAKIALPLALAIKMCLLWLWTWRKLDHKNQSQPGWGPFFIFLSSLYFGHKTSPNLSEEFFFFWSSSYFRHKTVPIPSKNCFSLVLHLRNSPPSTPLKIPGNAPGHSHVLVFVTQKCLCPDPRIPCYGFEWF